MVRLPSLPTIYKLYIILCDVSLCNWLSVVRGFPCCYLMKHSCNYSSCLTSEYEFQNVSQESLIKWRQNCFNYILQCMRENVCLDRAKRNNSKYLKHNVCKERNQFQQFLGHCSYSMHASTICFIPTTEVTQQSASCALPLIPTSGM